MPETDALWFLPAAVNYACGFHLLVNNLHPQSNLYDSAHAFRFAFYPPGFPWFLGMLSPEASPRGVYVLLAALNAATVLLTARFLAAPLRRQTVLSPAAAYGLGIAGLFCVGTYASSFCLGRPDYLATVLVLLGWAAIEKSAPAAVWFWAGLTLGALAFVQPVAGFIASALYGMWCGVRWDGKRSLAALFPAFAFAVALLLLLLAVNPNGFRCIVAGIRDHSLATLMHGTDGSFRRYFFIHSYAFGYGPLFVGGAALAACGLWARRQAQALGSPAVVIASAAVGLVLLYRFVAVAWDRFYNLWLFVPILILAAFILGFECLTRWEPARARRWAAAGAALLLLGSLGFVHRAVLFGYSLAEEATYLRARGQVSALLAGKPQARVGVSKSLWVLFDHYDPVDSFGLDPADLQKPAQYLFLQQRYTRYQEPPEIPGYRRIYDDFEPRKPRLGFIVFSPTMPSYRFAFYERLTPGAPVDPPAPTR